MKKYWSENTYYLILFGLSCLNSNLIYVFLLLLFLEIRKGSEGYLKICLLYSLRQVFYFPGLASITSAQSQIKLILLCAGALYVIMDYIRKKHGKLPKFLLSVLLFVTLAFLSAFLFGSYPIAGVVKVINFTLTMIAIMLAAIDSAKNFAIEKFVYQWLGYVMLISFFTLPFDNAYLRGSAGLLFRGIWDHPNDFGVACVIFLALLFSMNKVLKLKQIIQIVALFVMIFQSNSRGAMIGGILVVVSYMFLNRTGQNKMTIAFLVSCCVLLVVLTPLKSEVVQFFAKNDSTQSVTLKSFTSRENILKIAMKRFRSNPVLGRGLLISYEPNAVSLIFSEDGTEPGNIFLELLGGTGILGLCAYFYMVFSFYKMSMGMKKILVLTVVFASISEVSFFSVNNYACIYYLLFAIVLSYYYKEENEEIECEHNLMMKRRKRIE